MSKLLVAKVTVRGTRPLMWHRFGPDSLPLERQERTGVAGNDPEEWKRTYTATNEGHLYVDPSYIFGTIREGAKYTPKKRGTIQPMVAATLQVLDSLVFLTNRAMPQDLTEDPTQPIYLDIRSVKNPVTKARNVRYRVAASPGWEMKFTIMWEAIIVSRGEMEKAVSDAGRFCGIGDGRSIGFGRFEVVSWEVSDAEESATTRSLA